MKQINNNFLYLNDGNDEVVILKDDILRIWKTDLDTVRIFLKSKMTNSQQYITIGCKFEDVITNL